MRCCLKKVLLSENIDAIPVNLFAGCRALTSADLGKKIVNIYDSAFANCCSLDSIKIPSSVKFIDHNSFAMCEKLESVVFEGSDVFAVRNSFYGCKNLNKIYFFDAAEMILPGPTGFEDGFFEGSYKAVHLCSVCGGEMKKGVRGYKCMGCGRKV